MSLSEEQLDQVIAAERRREQEPLNDWRTIAARAREEGLLRESDSSGSRGSSQPWLQAAAAILILIGGIAIGRTTIGLPSVTPNPSSNLAAANPVPTPAPTASSVPTASPAPTSDASFASVDDAADALNRALRDYQRASQYIAATNVLTKTGDSAAIYTARAAAFDKIVNATESALRTAPHDPVINQYYLATMGAQVATRQMAAVGMRGF
ncbi:MAG TPA: hypothetical protein VGN73_01630 [Gemmatimonadaceae bacterium]|jgi:hypothetical protein|nr:hypothetical protein [Gemmatimonadaceae bacterium]